MIAIMIVESQNAATKLDPFGRYVSEDYILVNEDTVGDREISLHVDVIRVN